ncbi:MAG: hypothetical protein ACYSWO_06015 [Planctomycetota bacterium]
MARNRGKKALYEVMSKARAKQGYGKTLEQMRPKKTEEVEPVVRQQEKIVPETPIAAEQWRKKPKIAQYNAGRFEFSVPYQVAIVLVMALLVVVLGSYRLGQRSVVPGQLAADEPGELVEEVEKKIDEEVTTEQARMSIPEPALPATKTPPVEYVPRAEHVPPNDAARAVVEEEETEPVEPRGNNVIVLVQFGRMADLVPVQEHFAEHGIETEIDERGGQYFLQTVERYDNPGRPGSDGFKAKLEIIRVGALYKGRAPAGLDPFAPHYFSDAYGRKVED